jgi:hypothetical protein
MSKINTNYNGIEYHVLHCMYEDFKDLISTHWYVVSKGRPTPEINLLEERITALEEDLNVKDDLFNMRQSYLPKEKRMSDKDRTDLYFLKKKYPLLFKDEKLQNVKEFFIEALSYKQTPTPQVKVIERELTQEDHYDLHTMMKLKDDEVN